MSATMELEPMKQSINKIDKLSVEQQERLMALPGFVVVAMSKGGNTYHSGICENSFSMSLEEGKANFWWIGTAISNFGIKHELEADKVRKNAERHMERFSKSHPDLIFELVDVRAEDCPLEFDWNHWLWASQPAESLSGVTNKSSARNLRFWPKEEVNSNLNKELKKA